MILVTYKNLETGQVIEKEYPDDELQSLLDRAWQAFGNPTLIQGGPTTSDAKPPGCSSTPKPRRKR